MIEYFVFEKLPVFFTAVYTLICDSALYRLLTRLWRAIRRKAYESALGSLFTERPDEGEIGAESRTLSAVDRVGQRAVGFMGKVFGAGPDGAAGRAFGKLKEAHAFMDFEFFLGIALVFFILCPGRLWHNVYGLVISFVLLAARLLLTASEKREFYTLRVAGASFFAFVLSTVISVLAASDRADALRVAVFFATSFIMALVIAVSVTDAQRLKKILGFIYAGVVVSAFYAVAQRVIGVSADPTLTDLAFNEGMPGRVFSTFENPNNYAEFLILTMPLCVAFCSMLREKRLRIAAFICCAVPFGALLMTYSRSGWVSFALSVLVFLFFYNKKLIPILFAVGVMAIPLLPSSVLARIATIGSTSDSSNMYRVYIWQGALRMLEANFNWLTGVGIGPLSFRAVYFPLSNPIASPAPHSHMLFLEIWIEQGLLGIVSYFAMIISAIRRSVISMKYVNGGVRLTLIAGVSALCGIAFASAAEYIWFYPRVMVTYFIVLGLLYACISIAGRERAGRGVTL